MGEGHLLLLDARPQGFLLQPLPLGGRRERPRHRGERQREPPGLLPPRGHPAGRGRVRLRHPGEPEVLRRGVRVRRRTARTPAGRAAADPYREIFSESSIRFPSCGGPHGWPVSPVACFIGHAATSSFLSRKAAIPSTSCITWTWRPSGRRVRPTVPANAACPSARLVSMRICLHVPASTDSRRGVPGPPPVRRRQGRDADRQARRLLHREVRRDRQRGPGHHRLRARPSHCSCAMRSRGGPDALCWGRFRAL